MMLPPITHVALKHQRPRLRPKNFGRQVAITASLLVATVVLFLLLVPA